MRATVTSSSGNDDASVSVQQFCVMYVCFPFKGEDHFSCQIPFFSSIFRYICRRSITFKNKEPMEVGLRYGWRFWEGMEEKYKN